METISTKNQTIWYDPELLAQVPKGDIAQIFEAEYWQQQDAISGSAQGRGTTWFIQLDGIQAALRHYRRGGLFGKLVEDQYCFSDWESTRCAMELNVLKALANAGVNVPKPIAARAIKSGLLYRADLMSERISNAKDLVDVLVNGPIDADIYRRIGQEVRKMHDAGVNHTDLNIHNILLDDSQNVWIIDFDKCGQQAGEDWKEGNLNRLKRSFLKEVNKRQIQWQESDWGYLNDGYMQEVI
ncbi:3-deoxy-D-manno-octulosonic acid kinase [Vibrio crassostreae]|uniref:3-deoxy-D-manno-octulosonic acid kinase n=1 Tax=Vibrio crassostreae TaxID=246167 RepID=UPI0005DF393B|nr:3-deoxy-D-manno-octulosonic acid kinase [Vibrio crassostreae]TCT62680.1 3-deoxy-D-manno-octulosonic acid kinase [Vibrio crassostreae]TCT71040.1 3-deoxy-D-manno-octulosonic acid kinase [Vibrio crassostreae]TCT83440.1 3-deoxy-D-manno-octulosonic acid kinase [Vibrio crassostreae]TCU03851.1 3-deoxy-D-manno-octulosonic acid kinase [Vibrio crassostreae]TDW09590.1 3-deoxy-D-manno-octulosonic acid kinase [Vibrio crassostreae]